MEHIYILDTSTQEIYHGTIKEDENAEDYLKAKGFCLDYVFFVIFENETNIKEIK